MSSHMYSQLLNAISGRRISEALEIIPRIDKKDPQWNGNINHMGGKLYVK
jgi:hypothetical protein